MSHSRLTVVLTEPEMQVLRQDAIQNVRRPRDHARFLLLRALGLTKGDNSSVSTNDKSAGDEFADPTHAFAGIAQ